MGGPFELYKFKVGEILTLKKSHPCGSFRWAVERVGQEIGIRCGTCGHFILMARRDLEKSVRKIDPPQDGGCGG